MKNVLQWIWIVLVGIIVFPIVTVVDLVMLVVAVLNRIIRHAANAVLSIAFDEDEDEIQKWLVNESTNYSYKRFINWLYPVEEEES